MQYRNQILIYIPTSSAQDAKMLGYYSQHPNISDLGTISENCAGRASEAFSAAGLYTHNDFASFIPAALSRSTASFSGAIQYYIPQGGPIPSEVLNLVRQFEPKK